MYIDNKEKKEAIYKIKEALYKSKLEYKNIDNAKYHHNSSFKDGRLYVNMVS